MKQVSYYDHSVEKFWSYFTKRSWVFVVAQLWKLVNGKCKKRCLQPTIIKTMIIHVLWFTHSLLVDLLLTLYYYLLHAPFHRSTLDFPSCCDMGISSQTALHSRCSPHLVESHLRDSASRTETHQQPHTMSSVCNMPSLYHANNWRAPWKNWTSHYISFLLITQWCSISDVLFTDGRGVSDFNVLRCYYFGCSARENHSESQWCSRKTFITCCSVLPPKILMHDAYISGCSENNIKCVVYDDLRRKNRTTRYNCRFSAVSLALRVIFSVSYLCNIFGSFTQSFNYVLHIAEW